MITIFEFSTLNAYWTGASREVADSSGVPAFWTDEPLPTIPDEMFARWNNPGWVVTDVAPPFPLEFVEPVVVPVTQVPPSVIA
jgi:hypothetical protein